MTQADAILLADARAALVLRSSELKGRHDLNEAFAYWLSRCKDIVASTTAAARRDGAQRTYLDVALLGYAADVGLLDQRDFSVMCGGLRWVIGRPASVDGAPTALGTDGIAALGIALGARASNSPLSKDVQAWLEPIAAAASSSRRIELLHRFLFDMARSVLGTDSRTVLGDKPELAPLRLSLSSCGLFSYPSSSEEDLDAVTALTVIRSPSSPASSPLDAAIRLVALDWVSRATPTVLPSRATVSQVAELLRHTTMALRLWTWESKGRTRGATPRRWEIDNEYHVQNLLWAILAPIFPDLRAEENTPSVGAKHPRADLAIPSLRLVIEVKFVRPGISFADITEEIAADAGLYFAAGSQFDMMVVFTWDDSGRNQEHDVFVRGIRELPRIADAVVVSRPGSMARPQVATKRRKPSRRAHRTRITTP